MNSLKNKRKTLDDFLRKLRTASSNALQEAVCQGNPELQITLLQCILKTQLLVF